MKNFTEQELILASQAVLKHSYSPYSKFRVGAALETAKFIYVGANVENRSYGLTVCAERNAVFSAVANRERKFKRLALASDTVDFITPCGACLQVLSEFCDDLPIILVNKSGEIKRTSLMKLYPAPFVLKK
ncbi:MAG: cytidine deaminase [Candidatus Zixiibacteriota bacterium]